MTTIMEGKSADDNAAMGGNGSDNSTPTAPLPPEVKALICDRLDPLSVVCCVLLGSAGGDAFH